MTVPQKSYLELKEKVGCEFPKEILLHNLKKLNGNVRECAREMKHLPIQFILR